MRRIWGATRARRPCSPCRSTSLMRARSGISWYFHLFPHRCIYWVTETKIWVCEGCGGCTAGKSGPAWRLVCGGRPPARVCVPVAPDRSPSYTNFSQLNIGSKSPKNSRRFAPKLLLRTLQKRLKIATFSRPFAPKCHYEAHLWVSRPN